MNFIWGVAILILGSCASLKTVETLAPPISLEEFLKEQDLREQRLTSVEGKLQFRYSVKRDSFSGSAKFVKTNQQSRFEVSDPMGRVRYWLLGDPMGVLAFYETDQIAYSASEGGRNYFKRFFGMGLTWEEFQNLWIGILPKAWRKNLMADWTYQSKNESIAIQVSNRNRQLSRILFKQNQTEIQMAFDDFDACCAQEKTESILGHSVEIKLADRNEKIELEWDELNILGQAPNPAGFSRKLPARVKVVNLDTERK